MPIVTWDPVPGASRYQVDVVPRAGGACNYGVAANDKWSVYTAVPSWTPLGANRNTAANPYPNPQDISGTASRWSPATRTACACGPRWIASASTSPLYGAYTYMNGVARRRLRVHRLPDRPGHVRQHDADHDGLRATTTRRCRSRAASRRARRTSRGRASRRVLRASCRRTRRSRTSSTTRSRPSRPTRRATAVDPKAYKDESTSYYWAVLPAACAERPRGRERADAAGAAELPAPDDAPDAARARSAARRSATSRCSSGRASRARAATACRSTTTRRSPRPTSSRTSPRPRRATRASRRTRRTPTCTGASARSTSGCSS